MPGFPGKLQLPVLDLSSAGVRMTPEQLEAIDDYCEIYDYELVDGVLIVRPGLDDANCAMSEEMSYLVRSYAEEHRDGRVLCATVYGYFVRTKRAYRRAHRVIWVGIRRTPRPRTDVPAIVIEFAPVGRREFLDEYRLQADEYHAIGVKEFWLIDRFRKTITVFFPPDAKSPTRVLTADEHYASELLPGFELPLEHLFRIAGQHDQNDA